MKRVYAIVGRKRSGKDTVADYICSKLNCKKHALATPLKELVCNIFNITTEQINKWKNEGWVLKAVSPSGEEVILEVSFRSILQRCGDSMKSFFGLDCFMRKFHEKLLHENEVVVSDARLLEERDWLIAHTNPTFIKIVRKVENDKDSEHRTEQEVDSLGYDVIIDNNGTLEELYSAIDKAIK